MQPPQYQALSQRSQRQVQGHHIQYEGDTLTDHTDNSPHQHQQQQKMMTT